MNEKISVTARYNSLKERVVIITGGGQGIGRGYAHYFSQQGAIPVLPEINGENGDKVKREIEELGGKALSFETDVSSNTSVMEMVNKTLKNMGKIDILINKVAFFSQITMAPFWNLPLEEGDRAMKVNITGSFYCARAVVPVMQDASWGRIVNVTSGTVALGSANYLHYITSKSAIIGMTRSMARELDPWNITVNTFGPGL